MIVSEKLKTMVKDLGELARKLNIEREHDAALAAQQAIVAVVAAWDAASGFEELEFDWEPQTEEPR